MTETREAARTRRHRLRRNSSYPNSSRTASTAITSSATAIMATPTGPRTTSRNLRLGHRSLLAPAAARPFGATAPFRNRRLDGAPVGLGNSCRPIGLGERPTVATAAALFRRRGGFGAKAARNHCRRHDFGNAAIAASWPRNRIHGLASGAAGLRTLRPPPRRSDAPQFFSTTCYVRPASLVTAMSVRR
jgi:hypothetical protein